MANYSSRPFPQQPQGVNHNPNSIPSSGGDINRFDQSVNAPKQGIFMEQQSGIPIAPYDYNYGRRITNKSKVTAALLAFFLGSFGVHRFYLGESGKGLLYIALLFFFISPILGLFDGIRYLTMSNDIFALKYGVN